MDRKNIKAIDNSRKFFTVAFDSYENTKLIGRVYHADLPHPISFCGAVDFVNSVEGVLSAIGYTREAQTRRIMASCKSSITVAKPSESIEKEAIIPGRLSTAELRISFRQNASWQGSICFNGETTHVYNSFLRLIQIIDEHLSDDVVKSQALIQNLPSIIAVDGYEDSCIRGSISQTRMDRDINFESAIDLARKVLKDKAIDENYVGTSELISEQVLNLYRKHGKKATFTVKILFSEHDSIQGILTWREAKQQINFRSFLELMMCADRILETGRPIEELSSNSDIQVV